MSGTGPAQARAKREKMRSRNVDYHTRLSRVCREAYEQNVVIEIDGSPYEPLEYFKDSEVRFLQAVQDAAAIGRIDQAVEIVRNLGPLYESQSHLVAKHSDRWGEILRIVSDASAADQNSFARAVVLVLLARRERVRNHWRDALAYAKEAVEWCSKRSDQDLEALALEPEAREILGEIYRSVGSPEDLSEAVRQFETGLACAKRVEGDNEKRDIELRLWDRLGYAHFLLGNHVLARAELVRSIRLHDKPTKNASELSRTFNNLGKVFAARQRRAAARRYYERSFQLKRMIGDLRGQAVCLHEIGCLHREDRNFEKAVEKLEESRQLKNRIDDRHGEGLSLMELGVTHDKLAEHGASKGHRENNRHQADAYYERALRFLTSGSPHEARVRARMKTLEPDVNRTD